MSPRRKKVKIEATLGLPNVIVAKTDTLDIDWDKIFPKKQPIILELGCGTGAYTVALAELFPEKNYTGIDVKGARIWYGAKQALERNLSNVRFLRAGVEKLREYFQPGEISEIWITFPDPFVKNKQAKHRLTAPTFQALYSTLLTPNGLLHLKTDDQKLFEFTQISVLRVGGIIDEKIIDLCHQNVVDPQFLIETTYEKQHKAAGKHIHYLRWHFTQPVKTSSSNIPPPGGRYSLDDLVPDDDVQ